MVNDDGNRSEQPDGDGTNAKARLGMIKDHIGPKQKPRKAKKARVTEGPADWSDVIEEFDDVRRRAQTPLYDTTGYQRHKKAGKLWVRERLDLLLDRGSFREIGSVSGTATWTKINPESKSVIEAEREKVTDFTPSNNVQVTADDFTVRAGHADGSIMAKTLYMEQLACSLKIPMIKVIDGASGGGSITSYKTQNGSYIPELELLPFVVRQLDLGIPNCAAIVGPAVGLGAARAASCHFSVMAGDVGSLFNAGPKIVEGATFEEGLSIEELGGPQIHCSNGVIDNYAANEKECYDQTARFLAFTPNHGGVLPPVLASTDSPYRQCPELRETIPRRRQRGYSVHPIITGLADKDSFFELGPMWGRTIVVGLARMDGRPVGIFANNSLVNAGALDSQGCQKLSKHLKLCDVMGLPLVQLVDIPGFAIGTVAERSGVMKWAMELCKTYFTTTIPIFTTIIRRCYGIGGVILVDNREPNCRVAWPSANWGSIPLDGGIEVNHRADLKKAGEKRQELYNKLEAEYLNLQNPLRTASKFGVEEVIDPAYTRTLVCEWTQHMYEDILPDRLQQRACGNIKPSFR